MKGRHLMSGGGPFRFCIRSGDVLPPGNSAMTTNTPPEPDAQRLAASLHFILRRYAAQVRRHPVMAAGALLLPALGDVLTYYAPPLVVARLLAAFARTPEIAMADLTPYILAFAALWLSGQVIWRVA